MLVKHIRLFKFTYSSLTVFAEFNVFVLSSYSLHFPRNMFLGGQFQ
jgi:hypothetical protein